MRRLRLSDIQLEMVDSGFELTNSKWEVNDVNIVCHRKRGDEKVRYFQLVC